MIVQADQPLPAENDSLTEAATAEIHDRVTEAYYGKLGQQFMRETQERIHWICRNIKGDTILDVGCSQGIVPILLAREGVKVIGIDVDPKAIEEAKGHLTNEPEMVQAKVLFLNADFLSCDCDKFRPDTVIMTEVLEHLTRPKTFVEAAANILPLAGRLVVTVPFGINDYVDHKHTFYVLDPLRFIYGHFDVVKVELLGKWLGIVAERREEGDYEKRAFTPTVALVENLEAGFFKIERNLRDERSLLQRKLAVANNKYRLVSDQATSLKQRMIQEEAARQGAERALQATAQLEQPHLSYPEEWKILQQQLAQVSAREHMHGAASHEAEKKLIRVQTELEATHAQLEEANQKYRVAIERASALERRVTQEELARREVELARMASVHEAETKVVRLEAELEQVRCQLGDANHKCRVEAEQLGALDQRVMQAEMARREMELARMAAVHEAETKVVRLEAELEKVRCQLSDANEKCQVGAEQIRSLDQRVMQKELARLEAEQARVVAVHEVEAKLKCLEAELDVVRRQADDANQKCQVVAEEVIVLQRRVVNEEAASQAADRALIQTAVHIDQAQIQEERGIMVRQLAEGNTAAPFIVDSRHELAQRQIDGVHQNHPVTCEQVTSSTSRTVEEQVYRELAEQSLGQLSASLKQSEQQVAELTGNLQDHATRAHEAEMKVVCLEADLEATRLQLNDSEKKSRSAMEQVTALEQQLAQETNARQVCEETSKETRVLFQQLQSRLEEKQQAFDDRLAKEMTACRDYDEKLRRANCELENQKEKTKAALLRAEETRQRSKQYISYQLGAALIQSTKSLNGLAVLPGTLLRLRKIAKAKKIGRCSTVSNSSARDQDLGSLVSRDRHTGYAKLRATSKQIQMISLLDEMSNENWRGEFRLFPLNRVKYVDQILTSQSRAVFMESCWKGNGGTWEYAFTSPGLKHANARALIDAIAKMKERKLPIVFWNKEDPMHYQRFLPVAKFADVVLTTDSNRIDDYRRDLPGVTIGVMPFSASPRLCNPSGRFANEPETICFAGSYYSVDHEDRKDQMNALLPVIPKFGGAIYDRMSKLENDRYAFPAVYQPCIREAVPFREMTRLYKKFKVFLNVNTITDSPTMMSRRVYELLACGTPVVSAPSRAIEEQFHGIVQTASTAAQATKIIEKLVSDQWHWMRISHRGYREVMIKHTYAERARIIMDTLGTPMQQKPPLVSIIVATCRPKNIQRTVDNVARQTHPSCEVIYAVTPEFNEADKATLASVRNRSSNIKRAEVLVFSKEVTLGQCLNEAIRVSQGRYIAKFDDDNFYLENYLVDMLLPFKFEDYDVVGKESYFCYLGGMDKLIWRYPEKRHCATKLVAGDAMIVNRRVFDKVAFPEKRVGEDTELLRNILAYGGKLYSADHFNFVKYRSADLNEHTWRECEEQLSRRSVEIAKGLDLRLVEI